MTAPLTPAECRNRVLWRFDRHGNIATKQRGVNRGDYIFATNTAGVEALATSAGWSGSGCALAWLRERAGEWVETVTEGS